MGCLQVLRCSRPAAGSRIRAVGVRGDHVATALCHSPALFGRALEPALSPRGVAVEGEHLFHVLEHVVEESAAKRALEVPLVATVRLLVGLEGTVKVLLLAGLLVLPEDVEVLENVVEVEVERLVEVVAVSGTCAIAGERFVSELIVFPPPLLI